MHMYSHGTVAARRAHNDDNESESYAADWGDLNSLQDPPAGHKPTYPYTTIIRYAIMGSPRGMVSLPPFFECEDGIMTVIFCS